MKHTRTVDTFLVFAGFVGCLAMIVFPPLGWGILALLFLAVAFGGDA